MLWFTAKAYNTPKQLTTQDIEVYDQEIKGLLPDILGQLFVVAALDKNAAKQMETLTGRIYGVDLRISKVSEQFGASPESSAEAIGKLTDDVTQLQGHVLHTIGGITGSTALVNSLTISGAPKQ
jgi:hypothetical protein